MVDWPHSEMFEVRLVTLTCDWAHLPSGLELGREVEVKEEKEAMEEALLGWVSQWSRGNKGKHRAGSTQTCAGSIN